MRRTGDKNGFALATVLGLLTLFFLVAVALGQVARLQLKAAARHEGRVKAYYLARTGLARAQYDLMRLWAKGDPYRARADGSWQSWNTPQGVVRYAVQDEGGKLNINRMKPMILERALRSMGLGERRMLVVRDSLLDWVDKDGVSRQEGAEDDYYLSQKPPYRAGNRPFETPAELTAVRGVDGRLAFSWGTDPVALEPAGEGLFQLFTVYKRTTKVDLNSAPLKVLLALPGLDKDTAAKLIEARASYPFRGFQRVSRIVGGLRFRELAPWITVAPGRVYTIVSRGKLSEGRARHTIMAVVRLQTRGKSKNLFWLDDVVQSWQP
jgi:type II secretory pathway component PulK